jgi:hypothetical protein
MKMARSRLSKRYKRRYRRNPGEGQARSNPPLFTDVAEFIGPGFLAFAGTRLLTHVAATQIAKRAPKLGKHAGAAASVGAFLAAWFLANRVKLLAKYQMPLIVGSGIAALQSLLQLYVPKLGWAVSDASPQIAATARRSALGPNPDELQPIDDDPNDYVYNDSYDPGRMDSAQRTADRSAAAGASSAPDDDLSDLDLEEMGQSQNLGIFTAN